MAAAPGGGWCWQEQGQGPSRGPSCCPFSSGQRLKAHPKAAPCARAALLSSRVVEHSQGAVLLVRRIAKALASFAGANFTLWPFCLGAAEPAAEPCPLPAWLPSAPVRHRARGSWPQTSHPDSQWQQRLGRASAELPRGICRGQITNGLGLGKAACACHCLINQQPWEVLGCCRAFVHVCVSIHIRSTMASR